MGRVQSISFVIIYLLIFLGALTYVGYWLIIQYPSGIDDYRLLFSCILLAGFGGLLYCLRGVYLNACVKNQWANEWVVWYILRPFVSLICGGVSYVFLKAGLLILEAEKEAGATNLGFYSLAFIAGMNVDKFISKIEDLAQTAWGIEKSRSSSKNEM